MSIEDVNFLRKIFPTEIVKKFDSGRTAPLLIRGICQSTFVKDDFVVKLRSNEITIQHYVNELIGSKIALELGLHVPEPVIIEITEQFRDTFTGEEHFSRLEKSIGYNFGSQNIEGFFQFSKDQKLSNYQLEQAVKIFVFDAFILNPDRGSNNPQKQNMFTNGEQIIIFDHESAFGFVYDLFPNKTPWILKEIDRNWLMKHHFYPYVKNKEAMLSAFIDKFDLINDHFWDKMESIIPEEWKTDNIKLMRDYLSLIVSNREIFKEQLISILK